MKINKMILNKSLMIIFSVLLITFITLTIVFKSRINEFEVKKEQVILYNEVYDKDKEVKIIVEELLYRTFVSLNGTKSERLYLVTTIKEKQYEIEIENNVWGYFTPKYEVGDVLIVKYSQLLEAQYDS